MEILMFRKAFGVMAILIVCLQLSLPAQAQEEKKPQSGPRKQLAVIIFSGLGGAVLGLSTLSFYGRPQDKLSNIAIGFAVGVITGTVFTTYKTAADQRELYYNDGRLEPKDLGDLKPMPITMNYRWTF
jgi:FtsH-binding integral membrane protein